MIPKKHFSKLNTFFFYVKKEVFCDASCRKREVEFIWLIEYDPLPDLKPG